MKKIQIYLFITSLIIPIHMVFSQVENQLNDSLIEKNKTININKIRLGFDIFKPIKASTEGDNLNYEIVGFVNQQEIVDCYAKSDTVVVPSIEGETWGLVVNEALQCGCRVIATDKVGASRDLLQTYPHEVIASSDANALRKAIVKDFRKDVNWFSDPNRYEEIPKPSDLADTVIQWVLR